MINRTFVAKALRFLSKQIFAAAEETGDKISLSSPLYIHNPKDEGNSVILEQLKQLDGITQAFLKRMSKDLRNFRFKESKGSFKERNVSGEKLSWVDAAGVTVEALSFPVVEGKPSSLISSCYIEDKKFVLLDLKKDVKEGWDEEETFQFLSTQAYNQALSKLYLTIGAKVAAYMDALSEQENKGLTKEFMDSHSGDSLEDRDPSWNGTEDREDEI